MDYFKNLFKSKQTHPKSLPFFSYSNKQWKSEKCDLQEKSIDKKELKFLTYNVWFEAHNFQYRVAQILKIIKELDCDFVCFQEVTKNFQQMMSNDEFIQKNYFITGNQVQGYGILILSKFKPINIHELIFNSQFGRTFVYIECLINNTPLIVGTSHLESMVYNEKLRQEQLNAIYEELKDYQNVIIMGDFNLETEQDEKAISNQYSDLWIELFQQKDPGYTFIIGEFKRKFDRVLLKKNGQYKVDNMQIVGKEELDIYKNKVVVAQKKDEVKTASDHYAILTTIKYYQ